MAKKKPFDINRFLKLSPEEQAKVIERETKRLLEQLPSLKKNLQLYNDVSDELYNLTPEEIELIGSGYANAVRQGEITTPTGKQAYMNFIKNLHKYARPNIRELALQSAEQRMDSWLKTIEENGSQAEIDYVHKLLNQMTDEQKMGFTRSRYFMDNTSWGSTQTFIKDTSDGEFSIQTLELELYLQANTDVATDNIYNREVATDGKLDKVRHGVRKKKQRRRNLQ